MRAHFDAASYGNSINLSVGAKREADEINQRAGPRRLPVGIDKRKVDCSIRVRAPEDAEEPQHPVNPPLAHELLLLGRRDLCRWEPISWTAF